LAKTTKEGATLTAARKKWNLTQQALADLLGEDRPRISHLERSENLSFCWRWIVRLLDRHGPKIFKE
jgi:transcriptional regulator with XRE-family HTH domain